MDAFRWLRASKFNSVATCVAWMLLLTITGWVYWPGTEGPELLDDQSSVLVIQGLDQKPARSLDYVFGDSSGLLGRSVSMSSFVAERLFFGGGTTTSKRVNVLIHLVNSTLLFWLFSTLSRHLMIPGSLYLSASLAGLWLVHPLHVSTVLYMVQRMTLLSCFFMLLCLLSYSHWRLSILRGRQNIGQLMAVPLFFVLGLLSKENAIVVIPILLLLEAFWFQFSGPEKTELLWLKRITLGAITGGAIVMMAIFIVRYDWLAARFAARHFTLEERLLTQSRVVWDYVAQWFSPQVSRMGVYHDDWALSTSLFEPASTACAVLAWLVVLCCTLLMLKWRWGRLLSFAIFCFVLGHSVESTVLSLELYFEHRNYFPAIGLVLLIGVIAGRALIRYPEPRYAIATVILLICGYLLMLTSSQVQIWSSKPMLTLAHVNGHPNSPRANSDMAFQLALLGDAEAAMRYSEIAHVNHPQERHGDWVLRNIALVCVAGAHIRNDLIDSFGTVSSDRPLNSAVALQSVVRLVQADACPGMSPVYFADHLAQVYLMSGREVTAAPNAYSSLAILENHLERYANAYSYMELYLSLRPDNVQGLFMQLQFALQTGRNNESEKLIHKLQRMEEQGTLNQRERDLLSLYVEI